MTPLAVDRAVTIVGGTRWADLVVPSTVPVADLLPQLARAVGVPPGQLGWELVPLGSVALPAEATLGDGEVADGDLLVVRPAEVRRDRPAVRSVRDGLPSPDGASAPVGGWSDAVGLIMTTLLVLPAVLIVGWVLTDRPLVTAPSPALLGSAVVLAVLAGWTALQLPPRRGAGCATGAIRGWPVVAATAGIGWASAAGAVLTGALAPTASGDVVGGGATVAAVAALLIGGIWARARASPDDHHDDHNNGHHGDDDHGDDEGDDDGVDPAAGCGALAAGAVGAGALLLAVPGSVFLGSAPTLRWVAVAAVASIGLLPGAAVLVTRLSRMDRQAAVTGIAAVAADAAGRRAARVLAGGLVGAVVVAVAALAARLPDSGPTDVVTATALAVVLALRGRTLGPGPAVIPLAGSAAVAVTAVALGCAHQPADRLTAAMVGMAVLLAVLRIVAGHLAPPSPTVTATVGRLLRGVERVGMCLVVPVASGALQWSVLPWVAQWWPGAG